LRKGNIRQAERPLERRSGPATPLSRSGLELGNEEEGWRFKEDTGGAPGAEQFRHHPTLAKRPENFFYRTAAELKSSEIMVGHHMARMRSAALNVRR